MVEYHCLIKTTMKISSLMQQLQNDRADSELGSGKRMKGKRLSGGMKCCMILEKAVAPSIDSKLRVQSSRWIGGCEHKFRECAR